MLIGNGDNSAGSATPNTVVEIDSRSDADEKFGVDTDLSRAYRQALANGANKNFTRAVMAQTTNSTESFATSSSGTLANAPIVDDVDRVSAEDTVAVETQTVRFVYETPATADVPDGEVHINPITGEWAADASADYDITYDYTDWSGALTAAENAIGEGEFGLIAPLSNAESVASSLSATLGSMRPDYKMALGLMGAQPNATSETNRPNYDTANYADNLDDDALFLVAPTAQEAGDESAIGAIAGLFAGNDIVNPVYNDAVVEVSSLAQQLSRSEAQDLADAQVIPIRDRGAIRVRRNMSTSTETDWERDYWRRRIVDLVIATTKEVAESILGLVNDPDTRATTQTLIQVELQDFVDDGMLVPNKTGNDNLYVDVYKDGTNAVGVDLGVTPYGIVKEARVELTINT